jgi:hypothetical protein
MAARNPEHAHDDNVEPILMQLRAYACEFNAANSSCHLIQIKTQDISIM